MICGHGQNFAHTRAYLQLVHRTAGVPLRLKQLSHFLFLSSWMQLV